MIDRAAGLVVIGAALAACGDDGGGGADLPRDGGGVACPPGTEARRLVEEIVADWFTAAGHVATYANPGERGFALLLPASDEGYLGALTLAEECAAPATFDELCEGQNEPPGEPPPPFWTERDRCSRLRCEAAGVGLIDVYLTTRPHSKPGDAHPFTYEAVTFDPNPFVTWRVDLRAPDAIAVGADISAAVRVGELDASHRGTITVQRAGDLIADAQLRLEFPALRLVVDVDVDHLGPATGTVTVDGAGVADIMGDLGFGWRCP